MANTYTFSIGGSAREMIINGLTLSEAANAVDALKCDVRSLDGSYRPAINDEIFVSENGTRIFGGRIEEVAESGLNYQGNTSGLRFRLTAKGFGQFADWQIITTTLAAGTLKSQLTTLVSYLSSYGTTLHGSQSNGPSMPAMSCTERKIADILNDLATISGYTWRIDEANALRMWATGDVAALFDVVDGDGHASGDVVVESTRNDLFCNSVVLTITGAGPQVSSEDFVSLGSGATRTYTTAYPASQNINDAWPNRLYVNGSLVDGGVWWGASAGPWSWDYVNHALIIDSAAPIGVGDVITVTYAIAYPFTVTATDATSISAVGERQRKFSRAEALALSAAQELADGLLEAQSETVRKVNYPTLQSGIKPGYTQTVTVAKRNLSGTLLAQEVQSVWLTPGVIQRQVSGVMHEVVQGTFRGTYEQWNGSGSTSGGGSVEVTGSVQQSQMALEKLSTSLLNLSASHQYVLTGATTLTFHGESVMDIFNVAFGPALAGITNLGDGDLAVLINSSGTDFNILHESGLALFSSNRILCPNNKDWPFRANSMAFVWRDATANRVRVSGTVPAISTADLSDYATGTWTPVVDFGGGTTGITYSTQNGWYRKLSAGVYLIGATIILTSKGSSTGTMHITGSPASAAVMSSPLATWLDNMAAGVVTAVATQIGGGASITMYKFSAGGAAALTDADCTNSSRFVLSGVVMV